MLVKGGTGVKLTPVPPLNLFNHWIIKGKEPPKTAVFLLALITGTGKLENKYSHLCKWVLEFGCSFIESPIRLR